MLISQGIMRVHTYLGPPTHTESYSAKAYPDITHPDSIPALIVKYLYIKTLEPLVLVYDYEISFLMFN